MSRLAADDPSVKAIFCVPRYSNPTGITYDADTVRGLARMKTAAPDFRIIWDNAYAVHHLYPDPEPLANMVEECRAAGHPDRPLLFTSTSKITFAGAGMSAIAGSDANMSWFRASRMKRTIGPDKMTQLRHVRFLPDRAALDAHMAKHAAILRPKFEAVLEILERELGATGVATWSRPRGGYFISLDVPDGCAARGRRARQGGRASSSPEPARPSRAARTRATATSGSRRASRRSPSCGRRPRSWRSRCCWSRPRAVRRSPASAAGAAAR